MLLKEDEYRKSNQGAARKLTKESDDINLNFLIRLSFLLSIFSSYPCKRQM